MIDIFKIVDNITPLRDIESIRVFKNKLDHTPFFTIAIPTYKRAGLLKEAIDSALNQEGFEDFNVMELILFIYLKTKRMKKNWKNVLLYIVRIIELLITGAAGGALGSGL